MGQKLSQLGLASIQQKLFRDMTGLSEWIENNEVKFPVLLKPVASSGAENVFICRSENELLSYANKVFGTENLLSEINNELLCQDFLEGVEYIVNTISIEGIHSVTDAWVCSKFKEGHSIIYDYEELICPSSDVITKTIAPYLFKVLDALEIKNGPAHNELMLTHEGPVLIETGARLHGSIDSDVVKDCMGESHLSSFINSLVDRDNYLKMIKNNPFANLKKSAFVIALRAMKSGIVKEIKYLQEIELLDSYHTSSIRCPKGSQIVKTINLITSPGEIYLVHRNREVLKNDYNKIRQLECKDLFLVESSL